MLQCLPTHTQNQSHYTDHQPFMIWLSLPLSLLVPCSPVHSAPAMQVPVLFPKHAKHPFASGSFAFTVSSCRARDLYVPSLLESFASMPPFQWGLPKPSPSPVAGIPLPFLLLYCYPKQLPPLVKQHTHFSLFVCCLPLLLECKLHEGRASLPVSFCTLFLVPATVPAHNDCSQHIVEWMSDA